MREDVFDYPFFNEGVYAYSSSEGRHILQSFLHKDTSNLLNLKGFIFHTSHCGSTLLCRMLNQIKNVKVLSESEAINGLLLSHKLYKLPNSETKKHLKAIIQKYQQKTDSKCNLVIKLTSWNVYLIDLFLQLFPDVPWIFIDREQEALLNSLLKKDGGFIQWWSHRGDNVRKLFLEPETSIKNKSDYLKAMILGHRNHAHKFKNGDCLFVEYPDFIKDYKRILNHFQLHIEYEEELRINDVMKYDSKSMKSIIWENKSR